MSDTDLVLPDDASPAQLDQNRRLSEVAALYRTKHERLCCELALGMESPEETFARYGYTEDQALALADNAAFKAMLERITEEVRAGGLSFRMKAKALAEELLPYTAILVEDPNISAAVRLNSLQWISKMAGHEKGLSDKGDEGKGGGGLTLSITFAGQAPQQVVTGSTREPITIEG